MDKSKLNKLLSIWNEHDKRMKSSFSMIASENELSPLAKQACASDFYSRYFFESELLWGDEFFVGSRAFAEINKEILIPTLKKFTNAKYVNIRAISGMNCMAIALSAYCKPRDTVFALSSKLGGHASTKGVSEILGLNFITIDNDGDYNIDFYKFEKKLKAYKPKLVYIDQAHCLFPIHVNLLSRAIKRSSSNTFLHIDSSHINGLIFGKVIENPLSQGADSFGGSFHKTFPGPHKAFIATSNKEIMQMVEKSAIHLVSHHHTAEALALAISLIEFEQCGGAEYALQTVKNAKYFAKILYENDIIVMAKKLGYTETHQLRLDIENYGSPKTLAEMLYQTGINVNVITLPENGKKGFRVGLNEPTRYGLKENNIKILAKAFLEVIKNKNIVDARSMVLDLKKQFSKTNYCFQL